ncbi:MAG: hypothetical protein LCH32_01610 [Bacteroidetes bacterium]|nr:hypothetical protein [Bacteroidota bacterium]MCA0429178.1 hypothetical protein [Bacteroidota bacterium]
MKKIIYISTIGLVLIFVSCNSTEKKAQKIIKDYLSKNLNDASSYESVEFSNLDSTFSNFYFSPEGQELTKKQDFAHNREFELKMKDIMEENPKIQDSIKICKEIEEETKKLYEEKEKEYVGEFNGWKMSHKYRAKNKLGAIVLGTTDFTFDKELTKIKHATNKD